MKGKILPNAKKWINFNMYSFIMEILGKLSLKGNFVNLEKDCCQKFASSSILLLGFVKLKSIVIKSGIRRLYSPVRSNTTS